MLQDLGYALRTLRKAPAFTAIAAVSLALGIGANSAIFSLADGMLMRPMPVPHASQLIVVQSRLRGESISGVMEYSDVSYPDFTDLRKSSQSFESMSASQYTPFGFTVDKNALPRMKYGVLVSQDFFHVMQIEPALGRAFRADDFVPASAVAMLGYDLWKTEFASSPDVLGRTIYLNGLAFTVIGVAPQGFTGPNPLVIGNIYAPIAMLPQLAGDPHPSQLDQRGERGFSVHGRLKPGIAVKQAESELGVISRQFAEAYPDTDRSLALSPATDIDSRFRQDPLDTELIVFLLALAGVVLLIACANVMNLMLSRGQARAREIAVRLAVGAARGRLIRQFLTESLVLAVFGGLLGLVVAQLGTDLFSQIRIPSDIPLLLNFGLDQRALWFTLAVSMASCVLFGLLPALRSTKPDLTPALKPGVTTTGKRSRFFGRSTLVVAQVAGSLLLLVLATQCFHGAAIVLAQPTGFRTDHILTASFDPSLARYTHAQTDEFYRRLLDRARELPGVHTATLAEVVPMLPGGSALRVVPEGYQLPAGAAAATVVADSVSEDYFKALDIPIVAGRAFAPTDRADTPLVAIVNQVFADKYFPRQDAVGKRFAVEVNGTDRPVVQIVGVARRSKYFFPIEPPVDYVYLPIAQRQRTALNAPTAMTLMLHTAGDPGSFAAPLRDLVRGLDAGQPVIGIRSMQDVYDQRAVKTLNVIMGTIAGMGLLGLALALVGLYGLMTYTVGLRQREIGIRMAIGASRSGVMKMVVKQGLTLAGIGVAVGVALWLAMSRPVMTLVGARSFSWGLLALVAAGLLGVAGIGAYLPARRASLVDPNRVLRQE
jgi:predicted permease